MRSSDPASLAAVDASIQKAVDAAVVEENARWGKPGVITVVEGARRRSARRIDAGEFADRAQRPRGGDGARVHGEPRRRIDRLEHSDEPARFRRSRSAAAAAARDAHALTESFDTTDAWMGTQHALLLTDRARAEVEHCHEDTKTSEDSRRRTRSDLRVFVLRRASSCCRVFVAVGARVRRRRRKRISIRSPGQNVLLITIDTLRADALGCYGGPAATPALDRLAAEGVRFDFAHAHAVVDADARTPASSPARIRFSTASRDNSGYRLPRRRADRGDAAEAGRLRDRPRSSARFRCTRASA